MMIKCLVNYGVSLKKDKIYKATKVKKGWYALIDEMGEEYVYPPNVFEVKRNVSDFADIDETVEERSDGIGFWNKNKQCKNIRIYNFFLKINNKNESYYLEHPDGGYIKFDNKSDLILQSGILITSSQSFFYVDKQPNILISRIVEEAERQTQVAMLHGFKVEWLVSKEEVVSQLQRLFVSVNIPVNVKFFSE